MSYIELVHIVQVKSYKHYEDGFYWLELHAPLARNGHGPFKSMSDLLLDLNRWMKEPPTNVIPVDFSRKKGSSNAPPTSS